MVKYSPHDSGEHGAGNGPTPRGVIDWPLRRGALFIIFPVSRSAGARRWASGSDPPRSARAIHLDLLKTAVIRLLQPCVVYLNG